MLLLAAGTFSGPVVIDHALTLLGDGAAVIDGQGQGTVVTITGSDVTLKGLTITRSGGRGEDMDAGVKTVKGAERVLIENNRLDMITRRLDALASTPLVIIGANGRYDSMIVYGLLSYSLDLALYGYSYISFDVKGLV